MRSRSFLCRLLLVPAILSSFGSTILATDLEVGPVSVQRGPGSVRLEFTVGWSNAWRNERNHDAVWVVFRSTSDPVGRVLQLAPSGHTVLTGDRPVRISPSGDRMGAFISVDRPYRGDVRCRLSLLAADSAFAGDASAGAVAWAIEMVYVAPGPFQLGDDHSDAVDLGAFFRTGPDGRASGVFHVSSEDEIEVSREEGALYYEVGEDAQYRGDQTGPIPKAYPKGTQAFYLMKYELTQGQYADFLNALPAAWRGNRVDKAPEGEDAQTASIGLKEGRFVAGSPARPSNFVTWADTAAFADWMALRPLSEFEYEKAARGPTRPVSLDYPWGKATRDGLRRNVERTRDLAHSSGEDERLLSDGNKEEHGASYYWVMDLSGSLWERVVSAGHPAGRAFRGSHGDGRLDPASGNATNPDWPQLSADGREADGIGYRGGAEYFSDPGITNPYSPVALRIYAAWNGGYRYKTYSARAGRTAPQQ